MKNQILISTLLVISIGNCFSQNEDDKSLKSKYIEVNGLQTHYLDFGGEGIPVILIHSEAWDAYTFKDFGPLLTQNNKVLAMTRPGYGQSDVGDYSVKFQGDHLIAFVDALNIEKAIFIGNSSVTSELTYLAENYPQRTAGLVYLSGLAGSWGIMNSDKYKADEMFSRASPTANSEKNNRKAITNARKSYLPKHFKYDSIKINVPALTFVAQNGRQGHENGVTSLVFIGSELMDDVIKTFPPSLLKTHLDRMANDSIYRLEQINSISDSLARDYFLNLVADKSLQRKIYEYHMENIYPSIFEAQNKFVNAFGDNLKLIKLDVPQIVGYEYRDDPKLIIKYIKEFLDQLNK
ncbi:alpha/beta fold hydrolase [Algoriphagus pacificus]|uniref:Alpha/beta hydrolase n=1 Tax=Algoriphagus pacificus TaxID=2811234 RepID=A0ABS3CIN8_9BACT|nr:alpha/beta hydrolase [Algoriphagus pacificus]MBN7816967.1 alpha/beta hydrolase [Algoriphagus pacificus]